MKTLADIYERHRVWGPDIGCGDKGGTHSYIPVYEQILAPYRALPNPTFMEIGLALGFSLAMWREYMPHAKLVGVDLSIVFESKPHTDTGTILITADATKLELLTKLGDMTFDVVIDDASHMTNDQIATFNLLKPRMKQGGLYVIEDILALDAERRRYLALHPRCEIRDLRRVKGRADDILILYHF